MRICKEDVPEVCVCCGVYSPKVVVDIYMNYRDGSSVTVIYRCKTCGKRTRTTYKRNSARPFHPLDGIRITAY